MKGVGQRNKNFSMLAHSDVYTWLSFPESSVQSEWKLAWKLHVYDMAWSFAKWETHFPHSGFMHSSVFVKEVSLTRLSQIEFSGHEDVEGCVC